MLSEKKKSTRTSKCSVNEEITDMLICINQTMIWSQHQSGLFDANEQL